MKAHLIGPPGAGPPSIPLIMMLDTGADVTCVPSWLWPSSWPAKVASSLDGVGGRAEAMISETDITIVLEDPDRPAQIIRVRPYITAIGEPLLGRDALLQSGFHLTNLG